MSGFDAFAAVIGRARAALLMTLSALLMAAGILAAPTAVQAAPYSYDPAGSGSIANATGSYLEGGAYLYSDTNLDVVTWYRYTIPAGVTYNSASLFIQIDDQGIPFTATASAAGTYNRPAWRVTTPSVAGRPTARGRRANAF